MHRVHHPWPSWCGNGDLWDSMVAGEAGLGKLPRAWPGKDGKAGVAVDGVGWGRAGHRLRRLFRLWLGCWKRCRTKRGKV